MDTKKVTSRFNSICPTPEELLLDAVRTNKLRKIKTLIKENGRLLSAEYPYPYFGRILYVACREPKISPRTIEVLLELGAEPLKRTVGLGEIIHVLARSANSAILKVLVKYLTQEEINHTFIGDNALLLLVKEADYSKKTEFLEFARILIKSRINVNHADLENLTAVLWAIKKDYRELIEVLLNNSFDLDIDNYTMNGKSARELIISKYPYDLVLPVNFTTISSPKDLLFYYLNSHNEDAFVNYNQGDLSLYKDSDNYTHTLLQRSCELGLLKATKHLLENKANVRKTTEDQTCSPLELAGENGHFKIVELFLEHDKTLEVPSSTLCNLLKQINLNKSDDRYETCFEQLLQTQDEDSLNSSSNRFQHTPLHYAVHFGKPKHIIDLLRKGSSLANKNKFGIMAIENIEADVLEQHLDDCVAIDKNKSAKNVYVTLKYNTLLPSPVKEKPGIMQHCEEGKQTILRNLRPETDALLYISKAPYLKHLLTHPVLDTFLLMKWHKINMIFYANLFFYIFFFTSLLTYIFSSYGNFNHISQHQSLLAVANTSHFILCLTYVILAMRECFQILVNPMEYYKDVDNWIEVILIFIVGFIIFINDPTNDTRKQLSSLAILLSTFELILVIGQHPRWTSNVVMFKRVLTNFIKFLAWYFLLIAAFAMSFFILFSESVGKKEEDKRPDDCKKKEENNFFVNPGVALFKTLVMLTGEFDASNLDFHSFPVTSKVIFIMFVLMIALILMNLLNGLAVSDTQSIKNDAEYVGLMARTEYIHYIESMVLGNILPSTLLNLLNNICCCLPFERKSNIIISQPFSKRISLYPKTEITIPMSNDFEVMKVDKKGSECGSVLSFYISLKYDKKIQRKIQKVMQKAFIKSKINQRENEQTEILTILQDIRTKFSENVNY